MKTIQVSSSFALVDDEDFDELRKYDWELFQSKSTMMSRRNGLDGEQMFVFMHNQVTGYASCAHVNKHGMDNRKENIRELPNYKTSKYHGITKSGEGWISQAKIDGKLRYLGRYPDEEDAASAYDYATRYYGDSNRNYKFNFPETYEFVGYVEVTVDRLMEKNGVSRKAKDEQE